MKTTKIASAAVGLAMAATVTPVPATAQQKSAHEWEQTFYGNTIDACDEIAQSVQNGTGSADSKSLGEFADHLWANVLFYADQARNNNIMTALSLANMNYCAPFTRVQARLGGADAIWQSTPEVKANRVAQNGFECLQVMAQTYPNLPNLSGITPKTYDNVLGLTFCIAAASGQITGPALRNEVAGCRQAYKSPKGQSL